MKFTSFKNARIVRSSWLEEGGRRLDCNPYMSGALEARDILKGLAATKEPLKTLTAGYGGGIYNGPMFRRNYVETPEHGVPFITSGPMLLADLSTLPLLRKKDAESARLSYLQLKKGTTLISCSGTIGRMVYVRPDMAGMWSSQDVLKVVPDESKIPPGYLYAFLSSKFGVPLVVAGTYGAIIQHIEPEHIAGLPVPRFTHKVETAIATLVDDAAKARSDSSLLIKRGIRSFLEMMALPDISGAPISTSFATFSAKMSALTRLDATFFNPNCSNAAAALARAKPDTRLLKECAHVFTPGIFKRMYAQDASYGYPYYSGSELFELAPTPRGYLSKRAPNITEYLIEKDWLLIQDAGQVGGLIGRVVRAQESVHQSVVSNHLMRIAGNSRSDSAYLFAVLSSPYGYRAIVRNAFGSSIPQLDPKHIGNVLIPWPTDDERIKIAGPILQAWDLIDFADLTEKRAIATIELKIEGTAWQK